MEVVDLALIGTWLGELVDIPPRSEEVPGIAENRTQVKRNRVGVLIPVGRFGPSPF